MNQTEPGFECPSCSRHYLKTSSICVCGHVFSGEEKQIRIDFKDVYLKIKVFIGVVLIGFLFPLLSSNVKGEIKDKIKSSMNDPDSFKLRDFKKSYSTSCNDTYLVTFSGKNGFGGTVTQTYYVIYKNDNYCIMGDWGSGGGSIGWSDKDFMKGMISSNGCSC